MEIWFWTTVCSKAGKLIAWNEGAFVMKKLLMCVFFGTSVITSAWAADSNLNCEALLTSQSLLASDIRFKDEISQIIASSDPSMAELKIKVSWGESASSIGHLWIPSDAVVTHKSLPRVPDPNVWDKPNKFRFVVALGGSKTIEPSFKSYEVQKYVRKGKTNFILVSREQDNSSKYELLHLYIALAAAPFVNLVNFDQSLYPTQMSYPEDPVRLAGPKSLRAIQNFRHFGHDKNRREEAAKEIKPEIVNLLQAGKQFKYLGIVLTGFSDELNVVESSKADSFTVEYFFGVPVPLRN